MIKGWLEYVDELKKQGLTDAAIAQQLQQTVFKDSKISSIIERIHKARWRRRTNPPTVVGKDIKPDEEPDNIEEIMAEVARSEPKIYRPSRWTGEEVIRFAIISDTHLNNMWTQITLLHRAYETFESEGIDVVYHCGDIDDGEEMRMGHKYECYTQGGDAHVDEIVRVYPKLKNGGKTYFITGNHDHSLIKRAGMDIGRHIANERDDMVYLGPDHAVVYLTDKCTMELRHPGDGTAYAISYKVQKMVEAMSGGEKPNIFAVGHYHKEGSWFYRNVQCMLVPTLCAQTPWMRGRGIAAEVGYYIVEIRVHDDGTISRFTPTFFPAYRTIKDDWKNWR